MAAAMQLTGSFLGNRAAFAQRRSTTRGRISRVVRAEKASSAGTWLPGIDPPTWLEDADLPANRGAQPAGNSARGVQSHAKHGP